MNELHKLTNKLLVDNPELLLSETLREMDRELKVLDEIKKVMEGHGSLFAVGIVDRIEKILQKVKIGKR